MTAIRDKDKMNMDYLFNRIDQNPYGNTNFNVDLGNAFAEYNANKNSIENPNGGNGNNKGNTENSVDFKNIAGGIAGAALSTPAGNQALDKLDPIHAWADGRESALGNGLSSMGNSLFTTGASSGNPWVMLAGAGVKILGGVTNRLFGVKYNKENINTVKNNIAGMNTTANNLAKANDSSSVLDSYKTANLGFDFNNDYLGKDGAFTHKIRNLGNTLRNQQNVARGSMLHELDYSTEKAGKMQDNNVLSTSAAYGGPLAMMSDNIGAIGYGLMSDYINMKNDQVQSKNSATGYLGNLPSVFKNGGKIHIDKNKEGTFEAAAERRGISMQELADRIKANPDNYSTVLRKKANFYNNFARHKKSDGGNLIIGGNGDTLFALGGDMQSNGADYSTGLTHIDAGNTHEENPNGGVQMGIAPDGQPNLVEENETIFKDQDYVFSNRIHPTKEVLKKFHMYSKGGKLTYADVSKRLEKEAKERPNDPISQASLKDMLTMLMDAQEQQKAEEETNRAREAFNALSPEEQQQVLAQLQQSQADQINAEKQQEAAMEAQENPQDEQQEVSVDENGNPIEEQQEPTPEDIAQSNEGSIHAEGGKLGHRFDWGGDVTEKDINDYKKTVASQYGFSSIAEFNKWLEDNGVDSSDIDWVNIHNNPSSINLEITAKKNAALADALNRGYDFGVYKPNTTGYNFEPFNTILNNYNNSTFQGKVKGNYQPDNEKEFLKKYYDSKYKDVKDLEGQQFYKDYTNLLTGTTDAAKGLKFKIDNGALINIDGQKFDTDKLAILNEIRNTANRTKTNPQGDPVPVFIKNDDGTYSIANNAKDLITHYRNDGLTGAWHLTPTKIDRKKTKLNLLYDPTNNTYSEITGDIDKKWQLKHTYNYSTKNGDNTYNYYIDPSKTEKHIEAVHKPEWYRYAGLMGPILGLGMQAAGIGKPDYSNLDAALEIANSGAAQASYKPLGNYLTYRPMDIWSQENRNDANTRATDRAIVNSSSPIGTKMAGLLANGYNSQVADAGLYRQALEYNDAQRQKVGEFNRGTDQFNADAFIRTSQFNTNALNSNKQLRASLAADAARTKLDADSGWYGSMYNNIGNIFTGIGDIGRENAQYNMIADMVANRVFGTMNPDTPIAKGQGMLKYVNDDTNDDTDNTSSAARGGRLKKRKRGLTI